jgi:hypothetical protein
MTIQSTETTEIKFKDFLLLKHSSSFQSSNSGMTSAEGALLFENDVFMHQELSAALMGRCLERLLINGPLEICFSTTVILLTFIHIC